MLLRGTEILTSSLSVVEIHGLLSAFESVGGRRKAGDPPSDSQLVKTIGGYGGYHCFCGTKSVTLDIHWDFKEGKLVLIRKSGALMTAFAASQGDDATPIALHPQELSWLSCCEKMGF